MLQLLSLSGPNLRPHANLAMEVCRRVDRLRDLEADCRVAG